MNAETDKAAELQRKARTYEIRERVAKLERERAGLAEVAQHLEVDVRDVEARLDVAQARCRWLSDQLSAHDQQNQELDVQIGTASGEVAALEVQCRSAEAQRRHQARQARLLQHRLRAQQGAMLAAERELTEVIESIRRLGYAAEHWAEREESPR